MFISYTYLLWLLCFVGLPLLALMYWRQQLWRQRGALVWTTLGALIGGWAWDALAVRVGLWHYDPARIAGLWVFGLPLKEWLWIVGVTLMFGSVTIILADRMGVHND